MRATTRPSSTALVSGGVRAIELTLSTAGVFAEMKSLVSEFGEAVIGLGTVTTGSQAEAALENGARFIVRPTTELDVIRVACDAGVPVFPGGLTPTELYRCWAAGASAVKLFPAAGGRPALHRRHARSLSRYADRSQRRRRTR